jgi:hypothetical protein
VAQVNRQPGEGQSDCPPATVPYAALGHPSIEQLMAEQGTGPITDVFALHGNIWPAEESVEEFAATIRERRGHQRLDPSA